MKKFIAITIILAIGFAACASGKRETILPIKESNINGFYHGENFGQQGAKINNEGLLSSENNETCEAWYIKRNDIPANKDFSISCTTTIDEYWKTLNSKEAQVGGGIFIAKAGNNGHLVYEADLCVIAKQAIFVQGQMIKNRLGEDPVDVNMKNTVTLSGTLRIDYKASESKFSLYFNDTFVGSQFINNKGAVNWNMKADDKFIIGKMGFSEKIKIDSHFPIINNFSFK